MKAIPGLGVVAGLTLLFALSANGQGQSDSPTHSAALAPPVRSVDGSKDYQYGFIEKRYVWSNKPLHTTASKICKVMRDKSFSETPYAINNEQDWNSCLETQIRGIGYVRWLQNGGFKMSSKNRKNAQAYLKKTYTMGPYGSYTFAQLSDAVKATTGKKIP
jgi:hypothetical protein